MLSRISSSAENCTQSSGVAGGMPVNSTMRAGTSSVGTASAKFETMPIHTTRLNQVPAMSKPLQVFHDRALVGVGEGGSVNMAAVAVAGHRRVVAEEGPAALGGNVRDEAQVLLIVDVVAAEEDLGPPLRWLQQIAHRRHRSVVQVRRARPDPVEG